jgi:hypothetical protein
MRFNFLKLDMLCRQLFWQWNMMRVLFLEQTLAPLQECMWLIGHQTKLLNLLTMSTFADQARYSLLVLLNSSVYRLFMF